MRPSFLRAMSTNITMPKLPISALPLPAASHLLTHALTPDLAAPSFAAFRELQRTKPSMQRRPRLLDGGSHFSYVAPYPQPFPYQIEPPADNEAEDKSAWIEEWLAAREALHVRGDAHEGTALRIHYPEGRDQPLELIGLAEAGLKDCLPHLDVGDAFDFLGSPTLSREFEEEEPAQPANEDAVRARKELVDVFSGHAALMTAADAPVPFGPWSIRYSGHQFGSWAGQLGDGRAISVLVTPHPEDPESTMEVQLKGSGRTPFSRSADGLAVLRSSIREYLCSEAMHALRIPTTRSLTLIHLPALSVERERTETACVLARLAPSFLRVGSFEALNGPSGMFFYGGGQQDADLGALRELGVWVARRVVRLPGVDWDAGAPWARELVLEISRRNARMVAGWQAYGWMHGVLNTDNISVLGLTIDFGPYAFMDVFDSNHICNHSDDSGRYSYQRQPSMIVFAMRKLLNALAPVIGYEAETGRAAPKGWADSASKEQVEQWTQAGLALQDELDRVIQQEISTEYAKRMHARLGLRRLESSDEAEFARPLLNMMQTQRLDFHRTFRALCDFAPSLVGDAAAPAAVEIFIARLLNGTPNPGELDVEAAQAAWRKWLGAYAARITAEREEWAADGADGWEARRAAEMRAQNPRFVLRQWVLEEVIRRVERDPESGRRVLRKVLHMASAPFEPWGAEADEAQDPVACPLEKEVTEERRFCGLGDSKMLGFQCSCSS